MKYVGNYKSWMDEQKIMEHLAACKGDPYPVLFNDYAEIQDNPVLEKITALAMPGYANSKAIFHMLTADSPEMSNFNFKLPDLPETRNQIMWWFVKLYPGEYQIIHIDPQVHEAINLVRYTLLLQDWEPGHIFIWDDKYLSNYKAGDMFEWSNPTTLHAPANIGYNTRYTLQIVMSD
jgi:hypothetical protein